MKSFLFTLRNILANLESYRLFSQPFEKIRFRRNLRKVKGNQKCQTFIACTAE